MFYRKRTDNPGDKYALCVKKSNNRMKDICHLENQLVAPKQFSTF